jgi:hypothetical protein
VQVDERRSSQPGAAPPAASLPSLELRLRRRRARLQSTLGNVQVICGVLALASVLLVVSAVFEFLPWVFWPAGREDLVAPMAAACVYLLPAAFALVLAVHSARDAGRRWGRREMALTDLPLLACDEDCAKQIFQVMESVPGLRWVSPPPPRTLEQQLEFAACYHRAYRHLRICPGRLDTKSVVLGSLAWFLGQRMCCFCGCLSAPACLHLGVFLVAPLVWLLGVRAYAFRLGVETAYLDYFLEQGAWAGE